MSQLITDADEPRADWHDEEWACRAGTLSKAERMRRVSAVSVLMDDVDGICDGLYSELVVLGEALRGEDLKDAGTFTHQETAVEYLEDFMRSIRTLVGGLEEVARRVAAWPQETGDGGDL